MNVILSATPENFLSEPDPTNDLVLSVSAIPVTGILPNGCSAKLRISGSVVPRRRSSAVSSGGSAENLS